MLVSNVQPIFYDCDDTAKDTQMLLKQMKIEYLVGRPSCLQKGDVLLSLAYDFHNCTLLVRFSGLRKNFGWVIGRYHRNHGLCCIWASYTISLKPRHAAWKWLSVTEMPQPEAMLFCGKGFVSLQQSGGRASWSLSGPAVTLVQVTGPTAYCWTCKRKYDGDCLPSLRAGDRKRTWKCYVKAIAIPLVFFCLRCMYASGELLLLLGFWGPVFSAFTLEQFFVHVIGFVFLVTVNTMGIWH